MTNRNFFEAVIAGALTDEVRAHAEEALAKMDAKNASRSSKPTKKQIENEPIVAKILTHISETGGAFGTEIAEAIGVTANKVSGLCTTLVNDGRLAKEKRKVTGKGAQTFYTIPVVG